MMADSSSFPGTSLHQILLELIVRHYQDDSRILAVCLFGSLARGNWDVYSDLDLDVVIDDGVQIDVMAELETLCGAFEPLQQYPLIIVPDGEDAADVVLNSLMEFSIRYHTCATTSPNIVDNLQLLTGRLDLETIRAAGLANRTSPHTVNGHDLDRCLRWAVEVQTRLHRGHFWQAEQLLQYSRQTLIEIFSVSHGYPRAYQAFEAHAPDVLKARLGATFPNYSLDSIRKALLALLDLLENDLDTLSNGQLPLSDKQRDVIAKVRRQ